MRLEQYESTANAAQTIFTFTSEGPKGKILKQVQFSKLKLKRLRNIYNLGFGDSIENSDDIDDLIITDNQDRDKVLATVLNTVFIFSENYPKAKILFEGSTTTRTRLYQIAINLHFDILSQTFNIYGLTEQGFLKFKKDINYQAFLFTRKK